MNIGIVGFGKMGSAIFRLLVDKLHPITLLAIDEAEAEAGERICSKLLKRSLRRGKITEDDFQKKKESLRFTHRVEDLASADIVIEAIFEDYDEKVALLRKLESVLDQSAIILTNTSSISIQQLARTLKHKDRFCGLHFFYPVMLINLVEIIKCKDTSADLVKFLLDFCKDIGKQAIVVRDSPGSMINLIIGHYYLEGLYILEEGKGLPSEIDEFAKKFFYVGPCESLDAIGIDFIVEILKRLMGWDFDSSTELSDTTVAVRDGYHVPYLFHHLLSENRFGKKVSKGIYLYERDKPVDDVAEFYMNPAYTRPSGNNRKLDKLIEKRLLYSIFRASLYCYQEALSSLEEMDLGVKEILQMKNGPFTMMQRIGKPKLRKDFDMLAQNVGERFECKNFDFLHD